MPCEKCKGINFDILEQKINELKDEIREKENELFNLDAIANVKEFKHCYLLGLKSALKILEGEGD